MRPAGRTLAMSAIALGIRGLGYYVSTIRRVKIRDKLI
jgi:hypothetical protein